MKKLQVRKTGPVRLTSAVTPLYSASHANSIIIIC